MAERLFIAGDWGTTRLRLALCDDTGIIERRAGPGIGALTQTPEAAFLSLSAGWRAEHGPLPAYFCGVAGSRTGWREVPYVPCPADPNALGHGALRFAAGDVPVALAPGLSCVNPLGAPDVMRGEETQILGALISNPELRQGRHLLVLPGTHSKWAVLEDGEIRTFMTSPTGEIFALLRGQGSLALADDVQASKAGFERGLADSSGPLLQRLFETRSRRLVEDMPPEDALGLMSGLLIGAEIGGTLACFPGFPKIFLIGDPSLSTLYADALAMHKLDSSILDGEDCVFAGLRSIFVEPSRT